MKLIETGSNKYQFEESDMNSIVSGTFHGYITCPDCKGKVELENNQKDGYYLVHR